MIIIKKDPFTKEERIALLSLSNDLKRITTSIQRGSFENSKRFSKEAKRWLQGRQNLNDEYVKKLLENVDRVLDTKDDLNKAEDCLMYSVLLQNKAVYQENPRA